MKKLTFKVSSQKDCSIVSLIKEVNKISCRIYLDLEDGFIAVESVDDTMIDIVIELVDKYYTILGIDIDNTVGETTVAQEKPDVVEIEQNLTDLGPQSEDDLIIQKVEFENEYVQNRINNFLKTAYWALYNRRATEKDVGDYIVTCQNEISMRYSSKPSIEFSIGDIVDVNYGVHLPGEVIGGHVHAIVCNTLNRDMAYVVPITKARTEITTKSYLPLEVPKDATYDNGCYKGGTVLADKGKYVRVERFNAVIGKTKADFFEKLLYLLASAFDFTNCIAEKSCSDDDLPFIMCETPNDVVDTSATTEKTPNDVVNTSATTEKTTDEVVKTKVTAKKASGEETTLLESIGFAFDKLDSSKNAKDQVYSFLTDIGMTTTERMVTQSFIIACNIKKINYENVIHGLHEEFPNVKEEIIKSILKDAFKNWLKNYPTLAEKCPKISLMSVLKVFAKRFT